MKEWMKHRLCVKCQRIGHEPDMAYVPRHRTAYVDGCHWIHTACIKAGGPYDRRKMTVTSVKKKA